MSRIAYRTALSIGNLGAVVLRDAEEHPDTAVALRDAEEHSDTASAPDPATVSRSKYPVDLAAS